jgi:zinc finger/BTB domain-containing protein 26
MEKEKKKFLICEICNTHFTQKGSLKLHSSSVHEGKKQVRCEMCGQSFQQKCSLTRHIAEVHEGKKYVTTVVHKRVA